jgi:hypothetical protein
MHWRTSMAASVARLIRAAISIGRASSLKSTTQKPASEVLESRNGPSVAAGSALLHIDGLGLGCVGEALLEKRAPDAASSTSILHEVDHFLDLVGRLSL